MSALTALMGRQIAHLVKQRNTLAEQVISLTEQLKGEAPPHLLFTGDETGVRALLKQTADALDRDLSQAKVTVTLHGKRISAKAVWPDGAFLGEALDVNTLTRMPKARQRAEVTP